MFIKDFKIKIGNLTILGEDILGYEGFTEVVTEYEKVRNAYGNGELTVGSWKPSRDMAIVFRTKRELVDGILRMFNRGEYTLFLGDRKINVKLTRAYEIPRSLYITPHIRFDFTADDPYFYDVSDFGKNIAGTIPQFGFPWAYTKDNVKFGYKEFTKRTIFTNNGDDEVGVKFKVVCRGTVEDLKLENLATKEFMQINGIYEDGDVLEISTVFGDTYVTKNGVDIFENIDNLSIPFKMQVGDNFIEYSAKQGETVVDIFMFYSPKYAQGLEVLK